MRSRAAILDLFSTFIGFNADRFERWIVDPRLVKSMKQQTAAVEEKTDKSPLFDSRFEDNSDSHSTLSAKGKGNWPTDTDCPAEAEIWALYWHQQWQQQHPQATAHLCAYLQEPCYWAAIKITQRFITTPYAVSDGFQIAITHFERILTGYNPNYGSRLTAYARIAFGNCLRDHLRQQNTINICSDWGLLRRLSRTQLTQALLTAGYAQVESFVLAWKCFKAVCTPDPNRAVRSLSSPSPDQFAQMAQRYNQLRLQSSSTLPKIDPDSLATELQQCIQATRTYLAPKITSLNQPTQTGQTWSDHLNLSDHDTPMNYLLASETYAEQQHWQQQIGQVLLAEIATLKPSSQTLLKLYYQKRLTQKDIAEQLQIKQYQVSRKLSRIRQQLLLSVAKWSQKTLHISLDSSVLANVSNSIHEWLAHYYQSALSTSLTGQKNSLR